FAGGVGGEQRLGLALGVVGDQGVGGLQDRLGAAEVLAQGDDTSLGKIALEIKNIADVGTTPLVDRLVRIADHADVGIIDGKTAGDGILRFVGVLVFVDQDILKTGIELRPQLLVVFE